MEQTKRFLPKRRKRRRALQALAWFGAATLHYVVFSLLFDTPAEYELRHSTDRLKQEYATLLEEYDSLSMVVENVVKRDRNIFAIMFDSEPYNFDSEYNNRRVELHESLIEQPSSQMSDRLQLSLNELEQKMNQLEASYEELDTALQQIGSMRNNIPSIQPVTNHERTLQSHQGVDYAVPEGTRIFATADGIVKEVKGKNSTSGVTVVIDHRNGYTTSYSHLQSVKVKRGRKVQRGDIIALSGNSGLSLAPHLHYEVRYNGMRVDPIHYFFMELTPDEYQRIMRIAQSGMQSFD